jgi:hypothetical protein
LATFGRKLFGLPGDPYNRDPDYRGSTIILKVDVRLKLTFRNYTVPEEQIVPLNLKQIIHFVLDYPIR